MTYRISPHAFKRMADHDILPGEADAVVADPEWTGRRPGGNVVLSKGDLAVVVRDGVILTAYRLQRGDNGGTNKSGNSRPAATVPEVRRKRA